MNELVYTSTDMKPFAGSAWWTLSYEAIEYIILKIDKNPKILSYFKRVILPEEIFFQTILLNSPLKNTTVNNNLRYIPWEKGTPHPKILKVSDFNEIINQDNFFARKFDLDIDSEIIQLISEKILQK